MKTKFDKEVRGWGGSYQNKKEIRGPRAGKGLDSGQGNCVFYCTVLFMVILIAFSNEIQKGVKIFPWDKKKGLVKESNMFIGLGSHFTSQNCVYHSCWLQLGMCEAILRNFTCLLETFLLFLKISQMFFLELKNSKLFTFFQMWNPAKLD